MQGDYDYTSSGFDGFLSRSIDNLSQIDLDSQGPVSTAIRYDSAQTTGILGDTWRVGDIFLAGKQRAIEIGDSKTKQILVGRDSQGNLAIKVAPDGIDAKTAGDDELLFNSRQRSLKVLRTILGSYVVSSADFSNQNATIEVLHNLELKPTVVGSFQSSTDGKSRPIPFIYLAPDQSYFGAAPSAFLVVDYVDDSVIRLRLSMNDALGLSLFLSNANIFYKLYCLQETII